MLKTSELVQRFNRAFGRPDRVTPTPRTLTVTERELLGKLLFEEVVEYCYKGLGLQLRYMGPNGRQYVINNPDNLELELCEGQPYDPVESVDGLADVNVVIHHNAFMHGFDLDRATEIVNDSNMSKLGEDGKPIINGVTEGYRQSYHNSDFTQLSVLIDEDEPGFDSSKPHGKILKGPGYWEPTQQLRQLIGMGDS